MESTFVETNSESWLAKIENEVAAALVHKTELLRLRNWLRCPLLRLPAETFVQIISYIMEDTECPHGWRPIFSTCYRVHTSMSTTTDLWRRSDFVLDRAAHLSFMRSTGNLREITVDFCPWKDQPEWSSQDAMDYCWETVGLNGYGLHALDITGFHSHILHWSWIFERPLPRLHHLRIHFVPSDDHGPNRLATPVVLQLPMNIPLGVLDLCSAKLPWSSNLFTGLTELHLVFSDCDPSVNISEDELLRILAASPQLERLSLVELGPTVPQSDEIRIVPTRTIQLPNLTFLKLDRMPEFVVPILSRLDTPAIYSLKIHSLTSRWEVELYLDLYFPDNHLPDRLFLNPPVFEVWTETGGGFIDSLIVTVGSAKMEFDFDMDEAEPACTKILSCVNLFVPQSVITLKLDYSKLDEEWLEFFSTRPEVRSNL